jgi:hypothetical protein
MALVQKGPLFDCLTTISVMLERSEASQGGVDFDLDTFLHLGHNLNPVKANLGNLKIEKRMVKY